MPSELGYFAYGLISGFNADAVTLKLHGRDVRLRPYVADVAD